MLPKTSTQAAGIFVMDLMAAIKSTIIIDGFIVSIDMTTFVLLGGTVKVAYYVK